MTQRLITAGPYAGQNLDLPDDIAKIAVKDGWAVDTSAEGFDPFNAPTLVTAGPYAPSLQGYLDSLDPANAAAPAEPKPAPKAAAKAEDEPKPAPAKPEEKSSASAAAAAEKDYPSKKPATK